MPSIDQFVTLTLGQAGDQYGHVTDNPNDPHPTTFDCSELVRWACLRLGVQMPDGSWNQAQWCKDHGSLITVQKAIQTRGALLFRQVTDSHGNFPWNGGEGHVAVSLGNGTSMEAHSAHTVPEVGVFQATGRPWTHGATIPGFFYNSLPFPTTPGEVPEVNPTDIVSVLNVRVGFKIYSIKMAHDGGVFCDGRVYQGSYPGLKPQFRTGEPRSFFQITSRRDGKSGYTLWSNKGEPYDFGPDLHGFLEPQAVPKN